MSNTVSIFTSTSKFCSMVRMGVPYVLNHISVLNP